MKPKESYHRHAITICEPLARQYAHMCKSEILLHQYILSIADDGGLVKRNIEAAARELGCSKQSLYNAETPLMVRGFLQTKRKNGIPYWKVSPVRAVDDTEGCMTDDAHDIGREEIRNETKRPFWVANMKSTIAVVVSILSIVLLAGFQTCLRKQAPETEIVFQGNELTTDNLSIAKTNNRQRFTVVRVIDGDTVKLQTGESLRYIGIDTPETKHPRKPVEFLGKEASALNQKLVSGKDIQVEFDVQKSDKYGRLLGYVFLLDGTFVNAELVKQGYATVDTYPPNVRYSDVFRRLQAEAIKQRRGLWQKENPGRIRDKKQKSELELPFQKRRIRYAQFNPNRYGSQVRG